MPKTKEREARRRVQIAPAEELVKKLYLNEKEVAALTGRSVSTLRNDRFCQRNLPYYKIGTAKNNRSVRYKTEEVIKWIEGRKICFNNDEAVDE
ncbi:MAG TPA: helix-turn-helix domain-containing protein [Smithellaceae bacterium]|jgi:predicted DNA-binding transcriptional regulator AlpA|nr:helix-turn-helix domain-containing protein [Smithellaceae bacterium]HQG80595.1 helix-turn-helix domain-containing protein [Smithellaceae bacterium]